MSQNILLTGVTLTTALMAGLFYAYSCSVSPGLNQLSDTAYITAMQAINRAILNPVFFGGFLGAALLLPISVWNQYSLPPRLRFLLLLSATVVYLIGVFGVTMLGNVPLNEALAAFDVQTASPATIARQRAAFETPWNQLNTIRTVAALLTVTLVIAACLSPKVILSRLITP